jgi:hypothetical protein
VDALSKCAALKTDEKDKNNKFDDYNEDVSKLLTLAKLRNFKHDGRNVSDHFNTRIRLNGIKFNNDWWAIHKSIGFSLYGEILWESHAMKITEMEFEEVQLCNSILMGEDYDTLVYDPDLDCIELAEPFNTQLPYACTHKLKNKYGKYSILLKLK